MDIQLSKFAQWFEVFTSPRISLIDVMKVWLFELDSDFGEFMR